MKKWIMEGNKKSEPLCTRSFRDKAFLKFNNNNEKPKLTLINARDKDKQPKNNDDNTKVHPWNGHQKETFRLSSAKKNKVSDENSCILQKKMIDHNHSTHKDMETAKQTALKHSEQPSKYAHKKSYFQTEHLLVDGNVNTVSKNAKVSDTRKKQMKKKVPLVDSPTCVTKPFKSCDAEINLYFKKSKCKSETVLNDQKPKLKTISLQNGSTFLEARNNSLSRKFNKTCYRNVIFPREETQKNDAKRSMVARSMATSIPSPISKAWKDSPKKIINSNKKQTLKRLNNKKNEANSFEKTAKITRNDMKSKLVESEGYLCYMSFMVDICLVTTLNNTNFSIFQNEKY